MEIAPEIPDTARSRKLDKRIRYVLSKVDKNKIFFRFDFECGGRICRYLAQYGVLKAGRPNRLKGEKIST